MLITGAGQTERYASANDRNRQRGKASRADDAPCRPLQPAVKAPLGGVLVQRYQRLVYTIVRRIGLDDHAAADVFQTVFSR